MEKGHDQFSIEMGEVTFEYRTCLRDAGNYLEKQIVGGIQSWLKAEPLPPFLEHMSFRLGNQLFFIQVVDVENKALFPGSKKGLQAVANGCRGWACLMPMRRDHASGRWLPDQPNWGLVDAQTSAVINPPSLITSDNLLMTQWELQCLSGRRA